MNCYKCDVKIEAVHEVFNVTHYLCEEDGYRKYCNKAPIMTFCKKCFVPFIQPERLSEKPAKADAIV